MGWLWGDEDPLKQLDPSLRAFLEKEGQDHAKASDARFRTEEARQRPSAAPGQPQRSQNEAKSTPSTDAAPNTWRSFFGLTVGDTLLSAQAKHEEAKANPKPVEAPTQSPPESLFPDGRYASIWSTYRSEAETVLAGKSDQEKMHDILHAWRARQSDMRTAALENCAEEHWAINQCWQSGGVSARMTMCRAENRELERCVTLQRRFLLALGYASMFERSNEDESERIQMHADKLYLQMKDQEKAIEAAKEKGEPVPEFAPLIRRNEDGSIANEQKEAAQHPVGDTAAQPMPNYRSFDSLPEDLKDILMQGRLKGMEGPGLEVAKRELEAEMATQTSMLWQFEERMRQERRERLARAARGEERISDKIRRWIDFRDYTQLDAEERERAKEIDRKRSEQNARANAQAA